MDFFAIPKHWSAEDRWHALAMSLAAQHIRGFQEAKAPGAPTKWTDRRRAELRIAADDLVSANRANASKGVTWACKELAKTDPWKSRVRGGDPGEALRKQYNLANPQIAAALRFETTPNYLRYVMDLGKNHTEANFTTKRSKRPVKK
jgi:hypothetical protein